MTSSGFVLDWPFNLQRWREGEQQEGGQSLACPKEHDSVEIL